MRHWVCKHGREGKVHHDFEVRHRVVEHIKPHEYNELIYELRGCEDAEKTEPPAKCLRIWDVKHRQIIVKSSNHL